MTMTRFHDWDLWFDRLLQKRQEQGLARSTATTNRLLSVVDTMEERKKELGISDRDIAIVRYLAENPLAMIFRDEYTRRAFFQARKAMTL
jgi:hypothetical protein